MIDVLSVRMTVGLTTFCTSGVPENVTSKQKYSCNRSLTVSICQFLLHYYSDYQGTIQRRVSLIYRRSAKMLQFLFIDPVESKSKDSNYLNNNDDYCAF